MPSDAKTDKHNSKPSDVANVQRGKKKVAFDKVGRPIEGLVRRPSSGMTKDRQVGIRSNAPPGRSVQDNVRETLGKQGYNVNIDYQQSGSTDIVLTTTDKKAFYVKKELITRSCENFPFPKAFDPITIIPIGHSGETLKTLLLFMKQDKQSYYEFHENRHSPNKIIHFAEIGYRWQLTSLIIVCEIHLGYICNANTAKLNFDIIELALVHGSKQFREWILYPTRHKNVQEMQDGLKDNGLVIKWTRWRDGQNQRKP